MIVNAVRLKYIGDFNAPYPDSSKLENRTSLVCHTTNERIAGLLGIVMTSTFEIGLGIIAASMANLRPLFNSLGAKIRRLFSW